MLSLGEKLLDTNEKRLAQTASKLSSLNPVDVIKRGYSYTTDENHNTVTSVTDVKTGDLIYIKVTDGDITAVVK